MSIELEQRAQALRLALIDGDTARAEEHKNWLMGEAAAGLLYQDAETLMVLRAAVADLAPVADRYGDGQKGDRWRAVWELLYAVSETVRPLEQVRLARPETFTGEVLQLILDEPGVTPREIAERKGRQPNHVSNTLRALLDQGLVYRLPQGRTARYFAEQEARELAGATSVAQPPAASPRGVPATDEHRFPYLDEGLRRHWQAEGERPAIRPVGGSVV